MDDHDRVAEVQRHELQLDTAVIGADPDQTRIRDVC